MKKIFNLFILPLFLSLLLSSCTHLPASPPNLTIYSNDNNYNLSYTINGGNWFDEKKGGNSFDLGAPIKEKLSSMEPNQVSCNTILKLELSFIKDINNFNIYQIDTTQNDSPLIELDNSNYTILTPSTPGEYCYQISIEWDSTHNVNYLLKLICTK